MGIPFLYELFVKKEIELKQEKQETINILLLGIGGGTHDGPNLTDTIILASLNPEKKDVNMFSIPRDLWVPELEERINTAYADGEEKKRGGGLLLSKAVVEKVTGQPVDYVFVIDFTGFEKAIDFMGGVDVDVARSFDDYEYPVAGKENDLCGRDEEEIETLASESATLDLVEVFPCRYKHISFKKGLQKMDGKTALEFVRSRHAKGVEGTDFARSQRQQTVISAVRKKALSLGILLNPVKVNGLANIVKEHINTDIKIEEYDDFIKLARKMEDATVKNYLIGTSEGDENTYSLLHNPPSVEYGYRWVLIPRKGNGDFSEIKEYIDCIQKGNMCKITETGIRVSTESAQTKKL